MTTTERGRIARTGMGGFLNPPTHPEHTHSVEVGRIGNPNGCYSLTAATECEWLDTATKTAAKRLLDDWQRPDINTAEVQDWIHQVLGYFKGCYKGDGKDAWNCSNMRITKDIDPMLNIDLHAGVHLIRKYYPEYTPTAADFGLAYWGTKPGTKE